MRRDETRRGTTLTLAAVVIAAFGTRCAAPPNEDIGTGAQAINNAGDDVSTPVHNSAVFINGSNGNCTGTLIAPSRVLTANHCVTGSDNPSVGWGVNNQESVTFGLSQPNPTQTISTIGAAAVQWTGLITTLNPILASGTNNNQDVAILSLSKVPNLGTGERQDSCRVIGFRPPGRSAPG